MITAKLGYNVYYMRIQRSQIRIQLKTKRLGFRREENRIRSD